MAGSTGNVQTTLTELERKLKELERDLQSVGKPADGAVASSNGALSRPAPLAGPAELGGPAPALTAVPTNPQPSLPADPEASRILEEARERIDALQAQLGELVRFRDELIASANRLVDEYSRAISSLLPDQPPPAADPALGDAAGERIPDAWASETAAAGPRGGHAAPQQFEGPLTVDAGPFRDIATLSAFEQAIARIPAVADVYVRGFEGDRALIDVQLAQPVAFLTELRGAATLPFTVAESGPGRVTLTVGHAA